MLICTIVTICVVGAIINRPSESDVLSEIPTVIPEDEEILADETTVAHTCKNYYVTKYDKTNHWNECSICGQKYNVVAHTFTEKWTMGDSCSSANKCNHICSCGYSYQTNNNREHKALINQSLNFLHYQRCNECGQEMNKENCTKSDGSKITCDNLGICSVCNYEYKKTLHVARTKTEGRIECNSCSRYMGTISNITTNIERSKETTSVEFSFDLSITNSGNFNNCKVSMVNYSDRTIEYLNKEEIKADLPTIRVTGKAIEKNYEKTTFYTIHLAGYYSSTGVYIDDYMFSIEISPDIAPPVINQNIVQTNLLVSNDWATQKQITVSGTENFCSSVKLTLKDSEGNTYLNNAATTVTDNAWSYTFIPDIEADENGKEFTITVTDNLGNSSEQKFTVYKTDKKAPTITSLAKTSETWTKTKPFTFTATDEGSGGVQISIGNAEGYVTATKTGTTYSRAHTFTEEVYGNKDVTVYFKDALGNATSQTFKVYNIDSTKPTITKQEIINNEIVLTGNDRNATLNKEGSGISSYKYLGSSSENETYVGAGPVSAQWKQTTTNKIPLTEFERVKYAYIAAVDRAGNISNTVKVVLPKYKVTVNPNGGTWRGVKTNTELPGYNYKQTETIENPTRPGYEFTGWTATLGTITDTTYTFGLGNATLQAGWNLITPTIENNISVGADILSSAKDPNPTDVGAGPVSARK